MFLLYMIAKIDTGISRVNKNREPPKMIRDIGCGPCPLVENTGFEPVTS